MKKLRIYSMALCLMGLTACNDFLEPQSQSEFVPETVQSLNEMLIGEVYMGPESAGLYNILGLFDDDVACAPELKYDATEEAGIEKGRLAFSWDKDIVTRLEGYETIYFYLYKRITGCNAILDYIDGVSGEEEQKAYVKAQAMTMRAFYYFHLVNVYGKPYSHDKKALGVPLKLNSGLYTSGIPRNTVGEVYNQVVKDLLQAGELFSQSTEPAGGWKASRRATPALTDLLLSRVYLYMEEWEKAAEYGEKVIANKNFSLYGLSGFNNPEQNGGNYANLLGLNNPETIFQYGSMADAAAMGSLKMRWTEQNRYGYDVTYRASLCRVSDELLACYDNTPGDLRKKAYLIWDKPIDGGTLSYYCPLSKYEVSGYNLNISYTQWGSAIKVSEAYLNVAEAEAMLYKQQGDASHQTRALQLMNNLREQRFNPEDFVSLLPGDFASADELLSFVRDERRRELCFEHHRWFDLRRYGMEPLTHMWNPKEGNPVEYKLEKNDPGFTLLIPQSAFSLNPDLVQNESRGK